MDESEISRRIRQLVDKFADGNVSKFALMVGTSEANIRGYLQGRQPKFDFLSSIAVSFAINYDWLLTGRGEMLDEKNVSSNVHPDVHLTEKNTYPSIYLNSEKENFCVQEPELVYGKKKEGNFIPLYDVIAVAGCYSGANMEPVWKPLEYIDAGTWFQGATNAMRIYDDSMQPQYCSGCIVAMREVMDKRLIIWGQDYVVETPEIRVLKRLQRSEKEDCVLACSLNSDVWQMGPNKGHLIHEPFDIPVDMITRLYIVMGSVNFRHSGVMWNNAGV